MAARPAPDIQTPSAPDFLLLQRLDELPDLQEHVEACDRLSVEITALDLAIPRATERYAVLWKGFQGTTLLGANQAEDPAVSEAREVVKALEAQRKALAAQAIIARADLQAATVELRASLLPALREQLGAPIDQLLHGLEASLSVERLLGPTGHAQGRELVRLLLTHLQVVRAALAEGE